MKKNCVDTLSFRSSHGFFKSPYIGYDENKRNEV